MFRAKMMTAHVFVVAVVASLFATALGSIYSTSGGNQVVNIVNNEGIAVSVNVGRNVSGTCMADGNVYICGPGTGDNPDGSGGYCGFVDIFGIYHHMQDFESSCTTIEVDSMMGVLVVAIQGHGLFGLWSDGSGSVWDIASLPTCLFYNIFVDALSQLCTCIDVYTGDVVFAPYLPDCVDEEPNSLGNAGVGAVGCAVTYVEADPCLDIMYDDCTVIHCSYKGPFDGSGCTVLQESGGNCQGMSGSLGAATTLDLNGTITEIMENIDGSGTTTEYYYTETHSTVISNYCSYCGDTLDPCDPEPCLNGGTCSPERLSPYCGRCPPVYSSIKYECACPEGFFGSHCEIQALCDNVLTGSSGSFSSPTGGSCYWSFHSGCYPRNLETCWEIFGTPGEPITISFVYFLVEIVFGSGYPGGVSYSCSWDYIKVYEAGNNLIFGRYCGFVNPPDITTTSGYMRIELKTDGSGQYPGFLINYSNAGA